MLTEFVLSLFVVINSVVKTVVEAVVTAPVMSVFVSDGSFVMDDVVVLNIIDLDFFICEGEKVSVILDTGYIITARMFSLSF